MGYGLEDDGKQGVNQLLKIAALVGRETKSLTKAKLLLRKVSIRALSKSVSVEQRLRYAEAKNELLQDDLERKRKEVESLEQKLKDVESRIQIEEHNNMTLKNELEKKDEILLQKVSEMHLQHSETDVILQDKLEIKNREINLLEEKLKILESDKHRFKEASQAKATIPRVWRSSIPRKFILLRSIAHLKDDTIVVANLSEGNLRVFTHDGVYVKTMLNGKVKGPHGLAVNSKEHLIVSDVKTHLVHVFDKEENLLLTLPKKFKHALYVAVNQNDDIIISDCFSHCIDVFSAKGSLLYTYGTKGQGLNQLWYPHQVCTDNQDNIFIADTDNNRIHLLSPNGKFKQYVATAEDGLFYPQVISINRHGDLEIDQQGGKVQIEHTRWSGP